MGGVSLRLRDTDHRLERQPGITDLPASPSAARQRRIRWRDPKLWLGIVLVLVSVVVGARVLASADDTVAVWQLSRDIPAGSAVGPSDVRVTHVHFADRAVAGQYVLADQLLGAGLRATRDLQAGEMLAVSSVTSSAAPASRQLPLGVGASHAPADLRAGDHVEVWAVPSSSAGGSRTSEPTMVLRDVTVLSVGSGAVGVSAERQVLVRIVARTDVGTVLRQISGASVVLVRLAG